MIFYCIHLSDFLMQPTAQMINIVSDFADKLLATLSMPNVFLTFLLLFCDAISKIASISSGKFSPVLGVSVKIFLYS